MYFVECATTQETPRLDAIGLDELEIAPTKLYDLKAEVQDLLKEVNFGTTE